MHAITFLNKDKIVMGLPIYEKNANQFWLNLFHELAHVIYGHIRKVGKITEEEEKRADELVLCRKVEDFLCYDYYLYRESGG